MKVIRVSWNEWFCTGTLSIKPGKLIIFSSIKLMQVQNICIKQKLGTVEIQSWDVIKLNQYGKQRCTAISYVYVIRKTTIRQMYNESGNTLLLNWIGMILLEIRQANKFTLEAGKSKRNRLQDRIGMMMWYENQKYIQSVNQVIKKNNTTFLLFLHIR